MYRCLPVSFLLHALLLGTIAMAQIFSVPEKKYYMVDFVVGGSANSFGQGSEPKAEATPASAEKVARASASAKTAADETVNPKEDLLLKSSKKKKKKISKIAAPMLAIPSVPKPVLENPIPNAEVSGIPSPGGAATTQRDANAAAGNEGWGAGGGGTSGLVSNFPYAWYVNAIRKKIDENWDVSQGFAQKINAEISFTILRDGSIVRVEIERSSKDKNFDQLATRAIEHCYPFAPLPSTYKESNLRVHIRFSLKKN